MGVVATFNYASWVQAFPAFSDSPGPAVITGSVLSLAQVYCRNDGTGPINDPNTQLQALNLMVAHIAQLLYPPANNGLPVGNVGRLASATQGSVSASFEVQGPPSAAWFLQTQYGATYWQLILPFRVGFYSAFRGRRT
jgi:hypothetical protein